MTEAQRNGTVSELLAEQWFVKHNYTTSKPLNDFNKYDLVVDIDGSLQRVQVKTIIYHKRDHCYFGKLFTSHRGAGGIWKQRKYDCAQCDIVAFVSEKHNSIYLIPMKEVEGRSQITFYFGETPKKKKNYEEYRRVLYE